MPPLTAAAPPLLSTTTRLGPRLLEQVGREYLKMALVLARHRFRFKGLFVRRTPMSAGYNEPWLICHHSNVTLYDCLFEAYIHTYS